MARVVPAGPRLPAAVSAAAVILAALFAAAAPPAVAQAPRRPAASPTPAPAVDKGQLRGLEWRAIGPFRGGRSVAVAGVPGQPLVYYFGATGGGVWKTTDGGSSWKPVTDGQVRTGSVGALAVAESDPNVVYVGMGEGCIRGNTSHGDGVYRSTDAGKTWKHLGLADTRQIGRVRVHPKDPDLVYVAALGHAFGPNRERGVFRSKDGGKTWQNVLFVDEKAGAIDLAMDPTNPRVIYAAFWQVIRRPWTFESGGPGSALYKTTDGGDTWTKLTGEGLPKGVWGRVGVAVSPARPDRVWAVIEAEEGGVFRSDDAGKTWRRLNEDRRLRQRAWYYTHVYADPKHAETVYVLNVGLYRSTDGGRTFTRIATAHGDHHDLWIAPEDPQRMIDGDDGGAAVTFDGGASWSSLDNQPTAQFYHVVADDRFPYWLYGAQQDNSTVAIVSRTAASGIGRGDWYEVAGCESGYLAPDPEDPEVVYGGCYGGYLGRHDRRTGQERDVSVYPESPMGHGAEGMKYRFQWTYPIFFSRHDPNTLYAAGNVLFRSTNEGQSWQAVSPDLTRNDASKLGPSGGPITKDNTSVEYYGTIFAAAESPLEKGLLWAGSDDGLVHVSRDGGASWANVTPKDLPEWSMVSQVDPSPHHAGTMYLAVNRYKLDDHRPLVYVTRDYGKSWKLIVDGIPAEAFVRVVREDPARKGLLYAGTETGVHVSFDDGRNWQPLQLNLPVVPITDLVVKGRDVVVATQGRSFWILDDVTPLRQMPPGPPPVDAQLFPPEPAYRFGGGFGGMGRPSPSEGQNPPAGAIIYYSLEAEPGEKEEVTLEVLDAAGRVVRKFSSRPTEEAPAAAGDEDPPRRGPVKLPTKAGLNRFAWDLRGEESNRFKGLILWGGGTRGPLVAPGRYQVRLTAGGKSLTQPLEVRVDPRLRITQADLDRQFEVLTQVRDKLTEVHDAITRLREVRDQLKTASQRAAAAGGAPEVAAAADALSKKLTAIEEELYQTKNQSSQDPLNYPIRLNNKLAALGASVAQADAGPTEQALAVHRDLTAQIDAGLARLRAALGTDLPAFNRLAVEKGVPAVVVMTGADRP